MGNLIKLKMTAFSDCKYTSKVTEYDAMLNPESIKWDHGIDYNQDQPPGSSAPVPRYIKSSAQNLSFDLVIDCTGVVDESRVDLPSEIKKLRSVIYDYEGKIHRPYFIAIQWGKDFIWHGVLTHFDLTYKYFKPDGTPLRATVALKFMSYVDPVTLSKQENKQSPDMTHLIDVVAGDLLAQLSQNTYGRSDYTVHLAEFNRLDKFRQLQPGSRLTFPPIVSETSSAGVQP